MNYYNNDNTILWSVSVKGTFTYGNGTSKATSSTVTTKSYDSNWTVEKTGSSYSGSTARGSARGKKYFLGIVTQTIDRDVSISCRADGTLY